MIGRRNGKARPPLGRREGRGGRMKIDDLRKKIDDKHEKKLIQTVRGRGYVLRDEQ